MLEKYQGGCLQPVRSTTRPAHSNADAAFRAGRRTVSSRGEPAENGAISPASLLSDFSSLGTFDVVFCRNVLIYFDQETKVDILGRIARADRRLFIDGCCRNLVGALVSCRLQTSAGSMSVRHKSRSGRSSWRSKVSDTANKNPASRRGFYSCGGRSSGGDSYRSRPVRAAHSRGPKRFR